MASGVAQAAPQDKQQNEVEALRKENELLRLNLLVVLEKVRAEEGELQTLRKQAATVGKVGKWRDAVLADIDNDGHPDLFVADSNLLRRNADGTFSVQPAPRDDASEAAKQAEAAIKALREAKDKEGQRCATEALEKALEKLKQLQDRATKEGKKGNLKARSGPGERRGPPQPLRGMIQPRRPRISQRTRLSRRQEKLKPYPFTRPATSPARPGQLAS